MLNQTHRVPDTARARYTAASEDHKRVIRELGMVKNKLLRDELLELAHHIQLEGQTIQEAR